MLTGYELLEKCELKPNMIVKALENRLAKPILQNRGWRRIMSMEYFWLWKRINICRYEGLCEKFLKICVPSLTKLFYTRM